ncbi:GNAT family N-acetyltransferase [Methanolobus sp. ZRKC5]|uniref:GNAT family N-acetyltransferase n=1 Tax=unclassified Methanolobus TaxID=2629569 RepID=UPI00313C4668
MFQINKIDKESIKELTDAYYTNITAPMDDMWESGIIPDGDFYTIEREDVLGYFVVDADNTLMQFFIKGEYENEAPNIFEFIKDQKKINKAFVSTYEPRYLSLCLDKNYGVEINSILYTEMKAVEFKKPLESISSEFAKMEELDETLAYFKDKVGIEGDWLVAYLKYVISDQRIVLFKVGNEIIGTGEMRPSHSSESYANIGVTVSKDYRKKNIGTYILSHMRILANEKGLKAICSTTIDNIASQRTIEKSGFGSYHRILVTIQPSSLPPS